MTPRPWEVAKASNPWQVWTPALSNSRSCPNHREESVLGRGNGDVPWWCRRHGCETDSAGVCVGVWSRSVDGVPGWLGQAGEMPVYHVIFQALSASGMEQSAPDSEVVLEPSKTYPIETSDREWAFILATGLAYAVGKLEGMGEDPGPAKQAFTLWQNPLRFVAGADK